MTRNQYMPCACAQISLAPLKPGKAASTACAEPPTKSIAPSRMRRIGLVDREDQLERDIEPLGLEEAELDRGLGGEIGLRDHVGHGELHGILQL